MNLLKRAWASIGKRLSGKREGEIKINLLTARFTTLEDLRLRLFGSHLLAGRKKSPLFWKRK